MRRVRRDLQISVYPRTPNPNLLLPHGKGLSALLWTHLTVESSCVSLNTSYLTLPLYGDVFRPGFWRVPILSKLPLWPTFVIPILCRTNSWYLRSRSCFGSLRVASKCNVTCAEEVFYDASDVSGGFLFRVRIRKLIERSWV